MTKFFTINFRERIKQWPDSATLAGRQSIGVARVSCALGQEIFLHPPSTKTTEFEVKNRCKKAEKQKQNIYSSYFVRPEGSKTHLVLETNYGQSCNGKREK